MRRLTIMAVSAALALGVFAAPAMAKSDAAAGAKPGSASIVDIVVSNPGGNFDVLREAVIRAGLVDLLSGGRQLTVFAPTDAAFETTFGASEATIIGLIQAGALDGALGNILGYHVTEGRRIGTSVLAAPRYAMLNGDTLTRAELVAAGVVAANISASNGVIHVLTEGVLLP
jgi:uncharacterized surface protein with fasciclin (FAS1) repeats